MTRSVFAEPMTRTVWPGVLFAGVLAAGCPAGAAPSHYPRYLPSPGGHVILPTARAEESYRRRDFAAARRVGDTVYLSGVVAGPLAHEGRDRAAFEEQLRRAFRTLEETLRATGLGFEHVAHINSFHVWEGPGFGGDRQAQLDAFIAVKREFMGEPHPAWTAVGVTGFLRPESVVEIQMTAHGPHSKDGEGTR